MDLIYHVKKSFQDYKYRKLKIGINSRVNLGVKINSPEKMQIGNNSYINGGVFTIGENSNIVIGNDVLISYDVHFRTVDHIYESRNKLIREQGHREKNIIVEDDVWVGYGAQIMGGSYLAQGSCCGGWSRSNPRCPGICCGWWGPGENNKVQNLS